MAPRKAAQVVEGLQALVDWLWDASGENQLRQCRNRWTLRVMVEGFRPAASAFMPPHLPHQVMERPNRVVI